MVPSRASIKALQRAEQMSNDSHKMAIYTVSVSLPSVCSFVVFSSYPSQRPSIPVGELQRPPAALLCQCSTSMFGRCYHDFPDSSPLYVKLF